MFVPICGNYDDYRLTFTKPFIFSLSVLFLSPIYFRRLDSSSVSYVTYEKLENVAIANALQLEAA